MLETTVKRLPLSKSIAARALILSALSGAEVDKNRLPQCHDTEVLLKALPMREGVADIADNGTALRFLTAFYAATPGTDIVLTGSERLCKRPVAPLVDALRSLGAEISYEGAEGHAPLRIKGKHLNGGAVELDGDESSQYASALAMIAPTLPGGLRIGFGAQMPSLPYLKMTLRMLQNRGVEAYIEAYTAVIDAATIQKKPIEDEADWSAAAFWYSIAGVSAGWVTLPDLHRDSLQGDAVLAEIGERFGVVTEFTEQGVELSATPDIFSRLDMNMADWPDLVPALAVTGALTGVPYVFEGVGHLRHKESDRLEALAHNLAQIGIIAEVGRDTFSWNGERVPVFKMPEIDPHGDHRIAMSFAVASLAVPGIILHNPETVEKSYPGFFDDLADAGFVICQEGEPVPEEYIVEE